MVGGDVTVLGGGGKTFSLHFDSNANAHLAAVLAANISAGVLDHSISASNNSTPPLSPGQIGEFVDTNKQVASLPGGYNAVVNLENHATIFGSGGVSERVLSGTGNLTFIATGGSGTVVAGSGGEGRSGDDARSGGNMIIVPKSDNGNWLIETGAGNDTISARGGGNDTIGAGAGHNLIRLGSGDDLVQSSGYDTIYAGTGAETVQAMHGSHVVIFAGSSQLTYVGGSGSATIVGSKGQEELSGNATLFGGGDFGHNRFVAAQGAATMTAGSSSDTFVFSKGSAGGDDVIQHFRQGMDKMDLQGYGAKTVADAIQSQTHPTASSSNLTLSDGTKISFSDVTNIKTTDFKLG